jgi:hypothetical protein
VHVLKLTKERRNGTFLQIIVFFGSFGSKIFMKVHCAEFQVIGRIAPKR